MVRKSKADAEKTREMLIDAAERVFLEKGFAAATLEQIAKEANMTRGAVYWHFESKMQLLEAMHERVKLPMDALLDEAVKGDCPLRGLHDLCVYLLKNVAKDERTKCVYSILLFKCEQADQLQTSSEKLQNKREITIEKFRSIFAKVHKLGGLAKGVTAKSAAIALHSYLTGILTDYLRNQNSYDISSLAPKMMEIFFRGILLDYDKYECKK